MPVRSFDRLRPGGMPSAAEYNRFLAEMEATAKIFGLGELSVRRSMGGVLIHSNAPRNFWARITGSGTITQGGSGGSGSGLDCGSGGSGSGGLGCGCFGYEWVAVGFLGGCNREDMTNWGEGSLSFMP